MKAPNDTLSMIVGGAFLAAFVTAALYRLFVSRRNDVFIWLRPCPVCGRKGLTRKYEVILAPTDKKVGQKRVVESCTKCGKHHFETTYEIPKTNDYDSTNYGDVPDDFSD